MTGDPPPPPPPPFLIWIFKGDLTISGFLTGGYIHLVEYPTMPVTFLGRETFDDGLFTYVFTLFFNVFFSFIFLYFKLHNGII